VRDLPLFRIFSLESIFSAPPPHLAVGIYPSKAFPPLSRPFRLAVFRAALRRVPHPRPPGPSATTPPSRLSSPRYLAPGLALPPCLSHVASGGRLIMVAGPVVVCFTGPRRSQVPGSLPGHGGNSPPLLPSGIFSTMKIWEISTAIEMSGGEGVPVGRFSFFTSAPGMADRASRWIGPGEGRARPRSARDRAHRNKGAPTQAARGRSPGFAP
jgi:hypothetical protein